MEGHALETSGTMTAAPPDPATLPTTPAMPPTGRDTSGPAARRRSAASCSAAGDSAAAAEEVEAARRSCRHRAAGAAGLLAAPAAAARLRAPALPAAAPTACDAPADHTAGVPCAAAAGLAARRSAASAWRLSIPNKQADCGAERLVRNARRSALGQELTHCHRRQRRQQAAAAPTSIHASRLRMSQTSHNKQACT